jgi:uncharacterized damage-inducible protein DinB
MDNRLQPVRSVLEFNASLFERALEGVDAHLGERRPNDHTNSLAFIACHVLEARFYLLKTAGRERTNPWQALFDAATDIGTMKEYPPLYELLAEWEELHQATLARLAEMTVTELDREASTGFPIEDKTILGVITFLAAHESYHVGQMGLIRKYLGLDPVVKR